MDAEALTREQSPFEDCAIARRALIFHDRISVAMALSRSFQIVDPVRAVDTFDDGFALADAFGQDPTAVILVGYRCRSSAAAEAVGLLLGMFPAAWVIGYGTADCAPLLVAAVTGGVRGVMLWSPPEPVAGLYPAPARPRRRPMHDGTARTTLTDREVQVLGHIAQGWSNPEIGRALSVSADVVKTQARGIYRKLGARDRAHAVAVGIRSNLI